MEPFESPLTALRTLIIILPETKEALLKVHHRTSMKTEFLEDGIMIGQFYSTCPFKATWNPKIRPHQSPVPFYVFRSFIENDWRFIQGYKPWKEIYLKRFGYIPTEDHLPFH